VCRTSEFDAHATSEQTRTLTALCHFLNSWLCNDSRSLTACQCVIKFFRTFHCLLSDWLDSLCSAVIYAISLAHYAITCARGWAANSINARLRLAADNDRLKQENQLLREELRIKDARMAKIDPHRRPYCPVACQLSGTALPSRPQHRENPSDPSSNRAKSALKMNAQSPWSDTPTSA